MRHLAARCLALAPRPGPNPTAVPGVSVYRQDHATEPAHAVYSQCLFLVVQGHKQARVGDDTYDYDPEHYLVTAVPLPVVSRIVQADPARPFLSLAVGFELDEVRAIAVQADEALPAPAPGPPQRGLASCPVTPSIREVSGRVVDLAEAPHDAPVLAPGIRRELLYRVLQGPRGGLLRAVAMGQGPQQAIGTVLARLHADCTVPVTVPDLASQAGMSTSGFHEAFRSVTGASPLQYVKRLRLQEAHRRITLGEDNVSGAAYRVGYHSLSQFSREFTRLFGTNPSAFVVRS